MSLREEFLELRKKYIEKCFSRLNPQQREAALSCDGACLILAGAGSGKTTVIINRIMCMLRFGNAYESDYICVEPEQADIDELKSCIKSGKEPGERLSLMLRSGNIKPWNIMAITFTNKAANQLKDRITVAVGENGRDVFASTFHSACVRFLRRDADRLGWPQNFTIYDTSDEEKVVKDIYKTYSVDDKVYPVKWMMSQFGTIRDNLMDAQSYVSSRPHDARAVMVARVYNEYHKRLKEAGAFDFDDLIFYSVQLLSENEDVRDYYHRRFKYVMVDEYQDTSHAQYMLIKLLTNEDNNVFVVGDDDQSIYSFRGATIENILSFDREFAPVKVVRLEQNYRSTGNILGCANSVIAKNYGRKGKNLWTAGDMGEKVRVHVAEDATDEAAFIAKDVINHNRNGIPFSAHAVLYRTNAQSNAVENYFARAGIPHKIVGGLRFFDRAEIKDVLAYLQLVENPGDNLRLKRIINKPARKIGDTTVDRIEEIALGTGVSMMEVILNCDSFPSLSRSSSSLKNFASLMRSLSDEYADCDNLADFTDSLMDKTGLREIYKAMGSEGENKLENMNELLSSVQNYEKENPEGDLSAFLEEMSLVTSLDDMDEDADCVVLMTIHTAKGLEFEYVYLIGMEDGLFPSERSSFNPEELEEERRLAYVGMTRAKKELSLVRAESRMLYGKTQRYRESRFIGEIDDRYKTETGVKKERVSSYLSSSYAAANKGALGAISKTESSTSASGFGRQQPASKPLLKTKPSGTAYKPGDRVNHRMFGLGTVISVTPVGGDMLVEVEFDKAGKKKAMANYAPMEKAED